MDHYVITFHPLILSNMAHFIHYILIYNLTQPYIFIVYIYQVSFDIKFN